MPVIIRTISGKMIRGTFVDGDFDNATIEYIDENGEYKEAKGQVVFY